jgi:hypothetical protein
MQHCLKPFIVPFDSKVFTTPIVIESVVTWIDDKFFLRVYQNGRILQKVHISNDMQIEGIKNIELIKSGDPFNKYNNPLCISKRKWRKDVDSYTLHVVYQKFSYKNCFLSIFDINPTRGVRLVKTKIGMWSDGANRAFYHSSFIIKLKELDWDGMPIGWQDVPMSKYIIDQWDSYINKEDDL